MRYALLDQSGNVVNVASWDGESAWRPPEGLQAIHDKLEEAAPGGFFDGRSFLPPIEPEPVPVEPTLSERLQALEAKVLQLEATREEPRTEATP